MVFVFSGRERRQASALFDKLFRLRHRVFIAGRGWSLPSHDGREIDQYDNDDAVYFVDLDSDGEVLAHVRLTPTMTSSLTADYFRHLVENGSDPRGSRIYEATRFMVLPTQRDKSRYRFVKAQLIAAAMDWAMANGIEHMQTVIDAGTLGAYVEMSTLVTPLGLSHPFGGGKGAPGGGECLVFRLPVNQRLLDDLKAYGSLPNDALWRLPPQAAA